MSNIPRLTNLSRTFKDGHYRSKISEPALRSSCLEACRHFILCPLGSKWLSNNQQATLYISLALLDQSHFVVVEACKLFSTCLLSQNGLLVLLDPSDQIKAILAIQSNPSNSWLHLNFVGRL
ncbi:unnamed protein product [Rhizopus stolonifer]